MTTSNIGLDRSYGKDAMTAATKSTRVWKIKGNSRSMSSRLNFDDDVVVLGSSPLIWASNWSSQVSGRGVNTHLGYNSMLDHAGPGVVDGRTDLVSPAIIEANVLGYTFRFVSSQNYTIQSWTHVKVCNAWEQTFSSPNLAFALSSFGKKAHTHLDWRKPFLLPRDTP